MNGFASSIARLSPVLLVAIVSAREEVQRDAIGSPWFVRAQQDDGRISAAAFADQDAAGRSVRDLRATSLCSLALLADGSTPHTGTYRKQLELAVRWLRSVQDEHGRFGLHTEPD